jgi:murein DD-endopeptidase MepM/ murein hydrolase activator NlpD
MQPDRPRGITLRLSNRQLAGACVVTVVFAVGAGLLSWALAKGAVAWGEVARLRVENERLLANQESLVSRIWRLQLQVTSQERRTQELAVVAGVELEDDDQLFGMGGQDPEVGPTADRLAALSSRSFRLSRLLDDVETRLAGIPSVLPASGRITSGFGYRIDPLTGMRAFHRGIDIGTDPERAVFASAAGVVRVAGKKGALGNAVLLAHGAGLTTRYGHLSQVAVQVGQKVEQGELVGWVGRTGRATGYHLHFEVLLAGRPVDPLEYVDISPIGR